MNTNIPSAKQITERLKPLRMADLRVLAERSGVPYRTLINIRLGATANPGVETVRKFLHLLPTTPAANDTPAAQAAEQGVANA